jgi:hypothetical protein
MTSCRPPYIAALAFTLLTLAAPAAVARPIDTPRPGGPHDVLPIAVGACSAEKEIR